MVNPYAASNSPDAGGVTGSWRGKLAALVAFSTVIAVAAVAAAIAPAIAHLAGAPSEFTVPLLQVSLSVCLPFGLILAYLAALCACRRTSVTGICWFFAVLLIIVPLAMHPRTAGPLVEYTGFALVLTVVAAIIAGSVLRRFTPLIRSPHLLLGYLAIHASAQ